MQAQLTSPVQETDNHVVSEAVWYAASRSIFAGVELRSCLMPIDWTSLGILYRDPVTELSIRQLAQVDGNNPDIRARFAAILADNDMAIGYRTAHARSMSPQHLGVTARDLTVRDLAHLEYTVYSFMRRNT